MPNRRDHWSTALANPRAHDPHPQSYPRPASFPSGIRTGTHYNPRDAGQFIRHSGWFVGERDDGIFIVCVMLMGIVIAIVDGIGRWGIVGGWLGNVGGVVSHGFCCGIDRFCPIFIVGFMICEDGWVGLSCWCCCFGYWIIIYTDCTMLIKTDDIKNYIWRPYGWP